MELGEELQAGAAVVSKPSCVVILCGGGAPLDVDDAAGAVGAAAAGAPTVQSWNGPSPEGGAK